MVGLACGVVDEAYASSATWIYTDEPVAQQKGAERTTKQLAIVIDDFGNRMSGTDEMLSLPVKLTVAVMPFLQTTAKDAEQAHRLGHEVIVHMPMEPKHGRASWMGPGGILTSLSDQEIEQRVNKAIDAVPHAVGMNNHMGSKATGDKRVMRIVLKVCKERGLYYLDSKTNYHSIVAEVGKEVGVPVIQNHVFLDDEVSTAHISKQCKLIEQHLRDHAVCVTIGHVGTPGKKTAQVLGKFVPELMKQVNIVPISKLIERQQLQVQ
ncbi:divergent polysaccharide deacetylase family protein [Paenibacillus sp. 481]|nr:divergent polysaccharide deacetylase family protein [Paenibacillus sp. 481]